MRLFDLIRIIVLFIILIIIFVIIRMNKANKYNNQLSKYTVKNEKNQKTSLGDFLVNIYNKFKSFMVNSLKKSFYFKNRSKKYERFSYLNNNPLDIFATKFSISIIFGFIYFLSSLYNNNFDIFILLLFMLIGYFVYNLYLLINESIRNKHIESDLLKAIIIMNNAFKSGYTVTQAIDFVSKDLNGPISDEFKRISNDLNHGLELKDAFDRFYNRVRIEDALIITSSLSMLNTTGGNIVGIFSSIERSFTNKKRIKDELNAMTSSSKLVFYILLCMPIVIISLLLLLSPSYFAPLINNPVGILIIFVTIILYFSYIFIIRKILRVER